MINIIPIEPQDGTWLVRVAQADAAMTQQAYWIIKAWHENIVPPTVG